MANIVSESSLHPSALAEDSAEIIIQQTREEQFVYNDTLNNDNDTVIGDREEPALITENGIEISETDDTLIVRDSRFFPTESDVHSPMKATMLSATLPGLGQIYNGKVWKVPFIYAGFGTLAYFVQFNNNQYQDIRRAWVARVDGNPNTVDEFPNVSTDRLERATNFYRRNLEITYILVAALYVLNILDATVDAHLIDFDVGEDLGLNLRPAVIPSFASGRKGYNNTAGVSLSFSF